jgi:hypothetical protein
MRKTLVVVGMVALGALARPALAQVGGIYLAGGVAQANPSGTETIASNPGGSPPSLVRGLDVKQDLGFPDKTTYFVDARYQLERWRFDASYREAHYEGTWSASPAPVAVEVDWSVLSFGVRYDLLAKPTWALGLGLDVDQIRHDSYSAPAGSSCGCVWDREDQSSATKAIPTVAFTLRNPEGRLWLDLKAGMSLFDGGTPTQKARVEGAWLFTQAVGVKGGWDFTRYKKEEGSGPSYRQVDFKVSGLYAGLLLVF